MTNSNAVEKYLWKRKATVPLTATDTDPCHRHQPLPHRPRGGSGRHCVSRAPRWTCRAVLTVTDLTYNQLTSSLEDWSFVFTSHLCFQNGVTASESEVWAHRKKNKKYRHKIEARDQINPKVDLKEGTTIFRHLWERRKWGPGEHTTNTNAGYCHVAYFT